MESPARIFVPEPLGGVSLAQPFWHRFEGVKGSLLFDANLPRNFFEYGVAYVEPEEAEAIVLPHNFSRASTEEQTYITHYAELGERFGIPVFVFSLGDFSYRVRFDPRVRVFRQSVYRSHMQPQDIITPALVGDNGKEGVVLRKKTAKPVVSFCGQAGYKTVLQWIKYYIKVVLYQTAGMGSHMMRAQTIGVYWRRRMIAACRNSQEVMTDFITRSSFSAAHRTIELDPAQARKDFINNIVDSDFVLAPKGDGNYSNRLYEALSHGRIPVLLDTECVLPLEGSIDYSAILVRVPMEEVRQTPQLIAKWYEALSPEDWVVRQHKAREVFETRLRFDSFFEYFFTTALPVYTTGV